METKISGLVPLKSGHQLMEIFGYSSKGLPGIEIIGLGKQGRALKEKLIYLCKLHRYRIPHRRYVICVEGENRGLPKSADALAYLELPVFLLFCFLAGILRVRRLDDCCASGMLSLSGVVEEIDYRAVAVQSYLTKYCQQLKIISQDEEVAECALWLPLAALLPQRLPVELT